MSITPIIEPTTSLKNARIGYKNLLTSTSSSTTDVLLIPNTWERVVTGSGPSTIKLQLSTATEIDFVALGAHNLGTSSGGETIDVSYATTIGGSLISLVTWAPSDDSAIMSLITPVVAAEIILTFAVAGGLELGVVYAGKALEMPHGIYGGHAPILLRGKTKYQSTMSASGQFLGRNIIRQGIETNYAWRHLDPDWYRSTFNTFVQSARLTPFFLKWRPDTYPDEVAFGHTTADIKPNNMTGGSRLIDVSFNMLGHSDI